MTSRLPAGLTRGWATAFAAAAALALVLIMAGWLTGQARLARIDVPAPPATRAHDRLPATEEIAASAEAIDGWVRIALARPLMSSARRPALNAGGSAVTLTSGLPRLAGTLVKADGGIAIFARDDSGHAVVAHEGSVLGPYRITRIGPNSVTLDGPTGPQTVHPRFGAGKAADSDTPQIQPPMTMPGIMPPIPGQGPGFPLQQPPP